MPKCRGQVFDVLVPWRVGRRWKVPRFFFSVERMWRKVLNFPETIKITLGIQYTKMWKTTCFSVRTINSLQMVGKTTFVWYLYRRVMKNYKDQLWTSSLKSFEPILKGSLPDRIPKLKNYAQVFVVQSRSVDGVKEVFSMVGADLLFWISCFTVVHELLLRDLLIYYIQF